MPDKFVAFYDRYYGVILAVAQQRLGGLADAEDVAAEVFRVAWSHYRDAGELELPWVYQTLRNMVGHEYRRRSRGLRSLDDELFDLVAADERGETLDAVLVRQSIAALAADDREILFMTYWEDLTTSEISQILGCSAAAVRVRLFRARRRLGVRLQHHLSAGRIGGE